MNTVFTCLYLEHYHNLVNAQSHNLAGFGYEPEYLYHIEMQYYSGP